MSERLGTVVVIGTGLIGGSVAGAVKAAGIADTVIGVGRTVANLQIAKTRGLVDSYEIDAAVALAGADLVVLAAPVDDCIGLLARADTFDASTIITDAASVKRPLADAAAGAGLAERFVGAHPMAGGTQVGSAAADPGLFRDRVVALCRGGADENTYRVVREFWGALGAKLVEVTADQHDFLVARTSHLPQMVVFALAASLADEAASADFQHLVGGGMRDTTRLAASNPEMWAAIARTNSREILSALGTAQQSIEALRAAIERDDREALLEIMRRSQRFRESLDRS